MTKIAKAVFSRKAVDIEELKSRSIFGNKPSHYVVEKIVGLDESTYNEFAGNLMSHYDFIEQNKYMMYIDGNDVWHCILVMIDGHNDGILVESEGYTYARYAAYLDEVIRI